MSTADPKTITNYTKSFFNDEPADINTDEYIYYDRAIPQFPNQAIFIYSFKERKLVYSKGWKDVLGYEDHEISMLKYICSTSPKHAECAKEVNQKSLEFIESKVKNLEEYSFCHEIEKIHKDGSLVPVYSQLMVHKHENGKVTEMIGSVQRLSNMKLGKKMQFNVNGPDIKEFIKNIDKELFKQFFVSKREREALVLMAKGFSYKEAADVLCISQSAIEKRIRPLFKRFNVKGLPHLISFAKDNNIL